MPRNIHRIIAVLAALGLGVSAYLTYAYLGQANLVCLEGGGCDAVKASPYAWIGPVPVPVLGLLGYALILLLSAAGRWLPTALKPDRSLLVFGLATVGAIYSAYLTYVELFVIYALCTWCVASAALMGLIWILSIFNVAFGKEEAA